MYILIFLDSKTYQLISKFLYMKPNNEAFPMKTCEKKPPFSLFSTLFLHCVISLNTFMYIYHLCLNVSDVLMLFLGCLKIPVIMFCLGLLCQGRNTHPMPVYSPSTLSSLFCVQDLISSIS